MATRVRRPAHDQPGAPELRRPARRSGPAPARWRTRFLLASFIAVTVVPLIVVGLSRAAYDNKPTAAAAKVIVNLGLTLQPACLKALDDSTTAATSWPCSARISRRRRPTPTTAPPEPRARCSIPNPTAPARAGQPPVPQRAGPVLPSRTSTGGPGRSSSTRAGSAANSAGVGAVLAGAFGLIGRGISSLPKVSSSRLIAVRHWLFLRVPLDRL